MQDYDLSIDSMLWHKHLFIYFFLVKENTGYVIKIQIEPFSKRGFELKFKIQTNFIYKQTLKQKYNKVKMSSGPNKDILKTTRSPLNFQQSIFLPQSTK